MIEVYNYRFNKDKIEGYIDGRDYLNRKKKVKAYLDRNYFIKRGQVTLILQEDGIITYSDGEVQGRLEDGKIYWMDNELIFEFSKAEGKIYDSETNIILELRGNVEELDDLDFFGIAGYFFELFA